MGPTNRIVSKDSTSRRRHSAVADSSSDESEGQAGPSSRPKKRRRTFSGPTPRKPAIGQLFNSSETFVKTMRHWLAEQGYGGRKYLLNSEEVHVQCSHRPSPTAAKPGTSCRMYVKSARQLTGGKWKIVAMDLGHNDECLRLYREGNASEGGSTSAPPQQHIAPIP